MSESWWQTLAIIATIWAIGGFIERRLAAIAAELAFMNWPERKREVERNRPGH